MNEANIILLIQVIAEGSRLIAAAIEAGRDVTNEELAAVFAKADAADKAWERAADANTKGSDNESIP